MSHFTVLVIGDNVDEQLAPYHEFECTGEDDQYVQDIDETEEKRAEYLGATETMLKSPTGELESRWDEKGAAKPKFYREPTPEETQSAGLLGSGFSNGLSFSSQDWGDGRGYRPMVYALPEGWVEIEVKTSEIKTFAKWLSGYDDEKDNVAFGETPDLSGPHKYGYTLLDENGDVLKVIRRTNPNAHWDWYQVGGRWNGFFKLKQERAALAMVGSRAELGEASLLTKYDKDYKKPGKNVADSAYKRDIDIDAMREEAAKEAAARWRMYNEIVSQHPPILEWKAVLEKFGQDKIEEARTFYHGQEGIKALRATEEFKWCAIDNESFAPTIEEHIARARRRSIRTFAVVKDGQWYERGSMGWWGCVSDEKDETEWSDQFSALLDATSDDTLLTIVDCHI